MGDTKEGAADTLGGSGQGDGDDIYDQFQFGEAAHGGAFMSLAEAEQILEFGELVARLGAPPATVQGRGRLRWAHGPAGTPGTVYEAARFDRRIGPESYVYLAPLERFADRAQSRRLTLRSLREKVEALRAGARAAKYLLAFESSAFEVSGFVDAAIGVGEAEARAIRRAAKAARRSGAAHVAVAVVFAPAPEGSAQGGWPRVAVHGRLSGFAVAELRVDRGEFWVWACGPEGPAATERRPVSELARRFGLKPL